MYAQEDSLRQSGETERVIVSQWRHSKGACWLQVPGLVLQPGLVVMRVQQGLSVRVVRHCVMGLLH